jgi:hypothetical protein
MNKYVSASRNSFLIQPYVDAKKNWKVFNSNYPLCNRIKHLVAAILLAIPIINYISYLIFRNFCSYAPKELSSHKPAKIKFGQDKVIRFEKVIIKTDSGTIRNT